MSTAASSSATVGADGSATAVATTTFTLPSAGVLGTSAISGLLILHATQRRQSLLVLRTERKAGQPLAPHNSEDALPDKRIIHRGGKLVPHPVTYTDIHHAAPLGIVAVKWIGSV